MLWLCHHLIPSLYATCHGPHHFHHRDFNCMNLNLRMTGAEPAARADGTEASALQPDAARLANGEPGTSGAAAASAGHDSAATGMAALSDAGGGPAATGAAWLAGAGDTAGMYSERTPGGAAAGAEADLPAEGPGQGSRPLRLSSAGDGGSRPGTQAASPQPYSLPGDWGGGGAPSPELEPASAHSPGGQGGAGGPTAPAPRCALPSAPAEGSSVPAGPSNPCHAVHCPLPCRPAEGVSAGAAEPAGSSDPVPELAGPAGHAQTRSCRRAGEGASARSGVAAQRSPWCQPAPSDNGPGLDAAPAGAAAGLGSAPQRRSVERSTSVSFERMALPDLSDSDREGADELACIRPEPPAEPGCDGPHRVVVSSAPITFNRVALPDSSESDGEGGTGPAHTGDPGSAHARERAQLQNPSDAKQELQISAGGHAGSRAAEGPVEGGAAVIRAASGSPVNRQSTGAAPDTTAARARQQVAFKRVRMAESSDESEGRREGSRSGSKRARRSPSEGCAHLGPAEGPGQAARSGLALARPAALGDSSSAACSGAPAAASCGRGPGGVAGLEVVARNDTELYVHGELTRWTKVGNCLHSSCNMSVHAISVHYCHAVLVPEPGNSGAPQIPLSSSSLLVILPGQEMHPAVHGRRLLPIQPGQVMHLLCMSAAGG